MSCERVGRRREGLGEKALASQGWEGQGGVDGGSLTHVEELDDVVVAGQVAGASEGRGREEGKGVKGRGVGGGDATTSIHAPEELDLAEDALGVDEVLRNVGGAGTGGCGG
jgi:hypothetical protein